MHVAAQKLRYSHSAVAQLTHRAPSRERAARLPVHDSKRLRISDAQLLFLLALLLGNSLLSLPLLAQDVEVPPRAVVILAEHAAGDTRRIQENCAGERLLRDERTRRASNPMVERSELFADKGIIP